MKKWIALLMAIVVMALQMGTGALAAGAVIATPEPIVDINDLKLDGAVIKPQKTRVNLTRGEAIDAGAYLLQLRDMGRFEKDAIAGYVSENEYDYVFATFAISNMSLEAMDLDTLMGSQLTFRDWVFDAEFWNAGTLDSLLSRTVVAVFRVPETVLRDENVTQCALVFSLGETEYEAPLEAAKWFTRWPLPMARSTGDDLFDAPEGESVRVTGDGDYVYILEVGTDWCKAMQGGNVGYMRSENLVFPRVGMSIQTVESDSMEPEPPSLPRSVVISAVEEDSPAAQAGLREEDLVMHVNGQRVTNTTELLKLVRSQPIGEMVQLTVYRMSNLKYDEASDAYSYDGEYISISIALDFID